MMQIIELFETIQNSAYETDEERADRLADLADRQGVSPETLYHIEEELDSLLTDAVTEGDIDPDAQLADLLETFAPLLLGQEIDGRQLVSMFGGYDTLSPLAVQGIAECSPGTARVAKYLYDLYRTEGYYEEAGIDAEANWAELDEAVPITGESLEGIDLSDLGEPLDTGGK